MVKRGIKDQIVEAREDPTPGKPGPRKAKKLAATQRSLRNKGMAGDRGQVKNQRERKQGKGFRSKQYGAMRNRAGKEPAKHKTKTKMVCS